MSYRYYTFCNLTVLYNHSDKGTVSNRGELDPAQLRMNQYETVGIVSADQQGLLNETAEHKRLTPTQLS